MRKEFPAKVKFQALKRCCDEKGIPHCEECGKELTGPDTRYDHRLADGLFGEPTLENCQVLCRTCHDLKTQKEDMPRMRKADRVRKRAFGIKPKGQSLPFGKKSKWKRKITGEIVRR